MTCVITYDHASYDACHSKYICCQLAWDEIHAPWHADHVLAWNTSANGISTPCMAKHKRADFVAFSQTGVYNTAAAASAQT